MRFILRALRVLLTLLMVVVAVLAGDYLWRSYVEAPWTRDGRLRSRVIQLTPDVSGTVTDLRISDNQEVAKGQTLFVIDPARYRLAVEQAQATVAAARNGYQQKAREAQRRAQLSSAAITQESREEAQTAAANAKANLQQAQASLDVAELNLQRTEVRSPVNGYVTNLLLDLGDYAAAGKPAVAVVDRHGFFAAGYFEETKLDSIRVGDPVDVLPMAYDRPLAGHVQSIARAVADPDNVASSDLIAQVSPTFSWVRLAQRIPVRVRLDPIPDDITLTSGMTATVVVNPDRHPPLLPPFLTGLGNPVWPFGARREAPAGATPASPEPAPSTG